ncbi:MAG: ABC transporter permease [Rhodospirillaceae bacterium]|nr:ABC transporter permease [Rhodospirillaceae bacterium]
MIWRFTLRRLAVGFVQLSVLVIAVFFLIRLLPADPVARFIGMNASPEAYALAEQSLGLDLPVTSQFGIFLLGDGDEGDGLIGGDLGTSWVTGSSVNQEIRQFLPVTLELITLSFLVAVGLGVPIGVFGAVNPGGAADKGTLIYGLFAGSQPEFSWGIIFIFIFFVILGVAPGPLGRLSPLTDPPDFVTGAITIDALLAGRVDIFLEALWYLSLPILTLSFVLSGPIIKMVRENVAQTMNADFMFYGQAAGLPRNVLARDALRAAFAPALTLIGILFGFMIGGAVLIESIFSISGLGQYAIRSILAFDYPAIQGVVLTISALTLLIYLAIDVCQALLDPRVSV